MLLNRAGIAAASVKFAPRGAIDEHSAPYDIDVICVAGEGFVSIGSKSSTFRSGQRVVH